MMFHKRSILSIRSTVGTRMAPCVTREAGLPSMNGCGSTSTPSSNHVYIQLFYNVVIGAEAQ
eukprot:9400442-Heterocapsa_arctica.AAC.1